MRCQCGMHPPCRSASPPHPPVFNDARACAFRFLSPLSTVQPLAPSSLRQWACGACSRWLSTWHLKRAAQSMRTRLRRRAAAAAAAAGQLWQQTAQRRRRQWSPAAHCACCKVCAADQERSTAQAAICLMHEGNHRRAITEADSLCQPRGGGDTCSVGEPIMLTWLCSLFPAVNSLQAWRCPALQQPHHWTETAA